MNSGSFRNKLIVQLGLSVFLVGILSTAWENNLKAQMFPQAGPGMEVFANVLILLLAMVFPAVTIYKGAIRNLNDMEIQVGTMDRRYKTIIEATNDLIFQLDTEGKIIYANPAVRLLGYEDDVLEGRHIGDLLYMDTKEAAIPHIITKRVGPRATYNYPVQLKTCDDSVLSSEIPAIEFVMDASGIWQESDHVVQTKGTQKTYIGTLCVARPVVDRALLEETD